MITSVLINRLQKYSVPLLSALCCTLISVTFITKGYATSSTEISPVAVQLREWQTLTDPNSTDFPALRYARFLQQHSQRWPLQNRILWRYQNALLRDDAAVDRPHLCPSLPITQWQTLLVCEPYVKDLAQRAQSLWVSSAITAKDETIFLQHYQAFLKPSDQWERYLHLEKTSQKIRAQRQIDRLQLSDQGQAYARFAYRFKQPNPDDLLADAAQPNEPSLLLLRLQYLRHQTRYDDALQLWLTL